MSAMTASPRIHSNEEPQHQDVTHAAESGNSGMCSLSVIRLTFFMFGKLLQDACIFKKKTFETCSFKM